MLLNQPGSLAPDQVPRGADCRERRIACGAERKVTEAYYGEAVRYGYFQTLAGEEDTERYVVV